MPFAPQQNWALYEERASEVDAAWLRRLSHSDRFAIYCDLFDVVFYGRDPNVDWHRVEAERWEEKLAARLRVTDAFRKLDQLRGTRT